MRCEVIDCNTCQSDAPRADRARDQIGLDLRSDAARPVTVGARAYELGTQLHRPECVGHASWGRRREKIVIAGGRNPRFQPCRRRVRRPPPYRQHRQRRPPPLAPGTIQAAATADTDDEVPFRPGEQGLSPKICRSGDDRENRSALASNYQPHCGPDGCWGSTRGESIFCAYPKSSTAASSTLDRRVIRISVKSDSTCQRGEYPMRT